MYFSFKGSISFIGDSFIVIEVNNIGYQVFVSNPENYQLGEIKTIYLYNVVREDGQYLVGFPTIRDKKAFLALIKVKGIGPKTALFALSKTTADELFIAIKSNNIAFLRRLPGVGNKGAAQILLDLRGFNEQSTINLSNQYDEVKEALKTLKFKVKDIDEVLANINIPNASKEEILKIALQKLQSKYDTNFRCKSK